MPRGPAQRTLTIYLLHDGVTQARAAVRAGTQHYDVRLGQQLLGDLYVKTVVPHTPPWVTFFEDTVDLSHVQGMSSAAVLVVRAGGRLFAIAFGFGRMLLQPGVVDERFGLKVTLNAVDHTKIRSVDRETLDSPAPHSQVQARIATDIAEFGLDIDQDLLRGVTGVPRDLTLGKRLTGADALKTTGPFTLATLSALLERYLAESNKTDYRDHFPWLDHIQEVKSPLLNATLDDLLVERLRQQMFEGMWLAVPERVDWQAIDTFTYRDTPSAERHDDIHLHTFAETLRDIMTITVDTLKRYHVYAKNDAGENVHVWTVYQCLYAELAHSGAQYLLNNSTWYQVDTGFRSRIENSFRRMPKATCELPDAVPDEVEGEYNKRVATTDTSYALMDRKLIRHPDPKSPVEFCDLYKKDKHIIHVKAYAGSSTLSHLFAQGVTSGRLFAYDAGFRRAVNTKLPSSHQIRRPQDPLGPREYNIVYAIISTSRHALNIPFFSKVTLQGAAKTLRGIGYNVQLKKVGVQP